MQPIRISSVYERGSSGIRTILALAVMGVAMYAAFQVFTAYDAYWTFEKDVETLARFAFVNIQGDRQPQIVRQITEMLDNMSAQYDKGNVKVTVDEGNKQITVDVWYAQTINVPFYPNPKQFHAHIQSTDTVG